MSISALPSECLRHDPLLAIMPVCESRSSPGSEKFEAPCARSAAGRFLGSPDAPRVAADLDDRQRDYKATWLGPHVSILWCLTSRR